MKKIIVKNRFIHKKIHYKPGIEVSEELGRQYPEHVKEVVLGVSEEVPVVEEKNVEGDLNDDGKFDEKDKSLAGKILRRKVKSSKKKLKKKK